MICINLTLFSIQIISLIFSANTMAANSMSLLQVMYRISCFVLFICLEAYGITLPCCIKTHPNPLCEHRYYKNVAISFVAVHKHRCGPNSNTTDEQIIYIDMG